MTAPHFFPTPAAFRDWLLCHAATATELTVGYYKVGSSQASMTWSESVDEALCFGWIDGVRKRIDDVSYQIRFTRRKATSIWSAINIAKFHNLVERGRMTAAGSAAFAKRTPDKSMVYAYEQATAAELAAAELQTFAQQPAAWAFFSACPPGYKKVILHWVTTAKQASTRTSRLTQLIDACAHGRRLR